MTMTKNIVLYLFTSSPSLAYVRRFAYRHSHGGPQAAFCLHVGLSELRSFFFYQRNGFKDRTNRQ